MPQRKLTSMLHEAFESQSSLPNSPNTPNTRKRQLDYALLAKHGLQGLPQALQLSPTPNRKRLQLSSQVIDLEPSQFDSQSTNDSQVILDIELPLFQEKKNAKENARRGWFWQYYIITPLDATYNKGKGKKKEVAKDEQYTCDILKNCTFKRLASNMHSSTTALSDHLEEKHRVTKNIDPITARSNKPTKLQSWAVPQQNPQLFEEALLDWVVYDCQAFTTTESLYFQRILKAYRTLDKKRRFQKQMLLQTNFMLELLKLMLNSRLF
jgi:hypothetical protein